MTLIKARVCLLASSKLRLLLCASCLAPHLTSAHSQRFASALKTPTGLTAQAYHISQQRLLSQQGLCSEQGLLSQVFPAREGLRCLATMPKESVPGDAEEILTFWFGDAGADGVPDPALVRNWFIKDDKFDQLCKQKAQHLVEKAVAGELAHWEDTSAGSLALVLVSDQLTRNMFRGTPQSFASEPFAREVARRALDKGYDKQVGCIQRTFFYFPFEHSEDLRDQELACTLMLQNLQDGPEACKDLCKAAYDYAEKHKAVIERFSRFPHRNAILGRESSAEEVEFLKQPGSSF